MSDLDREYWEPKTPPKPLDASTVHQVILEAGASVSRLHAERMQGEYALLNDRLERIMDTLQPLGIALYSIVVLLAAVAIKLWFF